MFHPHKRLRSRTLRVAPLHSFRGVPLYRHQSYLPLRRIRHQAVSLFQGVSSRSRTLAVRTSTSCTVESCFPAGDACDSTLSTDEIDPPNSIIQKVGCGGGGIPDAPAPELPSSLSLHSHTTLSLPPAVLSAAGHDPHLLAPAPHRPRPHPPISAAVAARKTGRPAGAGAMDEKRKKGSSKIPASAAGRGTGSAGAGAASSAGPAVPGPRGPASVPAAGAPPSASSAHYPHLAA